MVTWIKVVTMEMHGVNPKRRKRENSRVTPRFLARAAAEILT